MKVIDTDILIDHFHGHEASKTFIRDLLLSGESLTISVATVTELLAGIRSGEEERTEALLALFAIQPADEPIARLAGSYLNQYGAPHRLDLGDALIAATARHMDAVLYTRNDRHYPMGDIVVKVPYTRGK
ncbi:MAG: type II toxin-antitoxin system VapC family toxin [Chloroflexi bacterium]|nr:type II toxin-antitoxin system VapC family toxin [Chloroflexota bacterium]